MSYHCFSFFSFHILSLISFLTMSVETLSVDLLTVMLVLQLVHLTVLSSISPWVEEREGRESGVVCVSGWRVGLERKGKSGG
jgi:hypothetical membrane protein